MKNMGTGGIMAFSPDYQSIQCKTSDKECADGTLLLTGDERAEQEK